MKPPVDMVAADAAPESQDRRASWLGRVAKVLRFASHRAGEEQLLQVASSLTFTTVLAIVPMLAVVLSLFTAFPVFQEFRVALEDFLTHSLMPPAVSDNIMNYLKPVRAPGQPPDGDRRRAAAGDVDPADHDDRQDVQ